jgi:hypothetical protein
MDIAGAEPLDTRLQLAIAGLSWLAGRARNQFEPKLAQHI